MSGTGSKLLLDGAKSLPSYLPAGTYLSFTVIVQTISPGTLNCLGPDGNHPVCSCTGQLCGGRVKLGLTMALIIMSAIICFFVVFFNADTSAENQVPAPEGGRWAACGRVIRPNPDTSRSDELARLILSTCPGGRYWLATINTLIFLVLALLTPPVTTCFYPCISPDITRVVPIMVASCLSYLTSILGAIAQRQIEAHAAAPAAVANGQVALPLPHAGGAAAAAEAVEAGAAAGPAAAATQGQH